MDVDTVVLRDLKKFINNTLKHVNNIDILMQDDINMPCTGCMLLFPTNKTKKLVKLFATRDKRLEKYTKDNDQVILRDLRNDNFNINIVLFPHEFFPNGLIYLNNKYIVNNTHSTKFKSQICGDEIEIFLIIKDNIIKDFTYQSKLEECLDKKEKRFFRRL